MNVTVIFLFITFLSFSKQDGFDKAKFPEVAKVSENMLSIMAEKLKNRKVPTVTMELDDYDTSTYICATDVELRGMEKFDTKYELGTGKEASDPNVIVKFKFSEIFLNYGKMREVTPYCWICWWPYVKTQEKSHPITDTQVTINFYLDNDSNGVVNYCSFWFLIDGMNPIMQVANANYYHIMFSEMSLFKMILNKFIGYFALKFHPENLNKVLSYLMLLQYQTNYEFSFTVLLDELFQEAAEKAAGICRYQPRNKDPSKPPQPPEEYKKSDKFDKFCLHGR